MSKFITKNISVLDLKTKTETREWLKKNILFRDDKEAWTPILINTNFRAFFESLEEDANSDAPVICLKKDKDKCIQEIRRTKEIIESRQSFSFLLNSSIWIRLCEVDDKESQLKAQQDFKWFSQLELYQFKPAYEYIDYQHRAQSQNYLKDYGHGVFITPMIYSDEVKYRNHFFEEKGEENNTTNKFLYNRDTGYFTNNVSLRILLVDDKIASRTIGEKDGSYCVCSDCKKCSEPNNCKLRVMRSLLSGGFIDETDMGKRELFCKNTYWSNSSIVAVTVDSVSISSVWSQKDDRTLDKTDYFDKNQNKFWNAFHGNQSGVQIVGVRDLETALVLMSCFKFDMILLDYLLGNRPDNSAIRSYSTELFEFLSYGFGVTNLESSAFVEILRGSLNTYRSTLESQTRFLSEFQNTVKLNRGPLDKFWIMPMTSYNSSFISELQSKHVRLIDHRWNISQGADPINTPWKFLYKINEFIDLQLRQSVFWKEQLLTFLQFTCEDYIDRFNKKHTVKGNDGQTCFDDFQSFMGAEYANFMKRYGARKLIERDADEGEGINQSLFAKYIKDTFYSQFKEHGVVLELNRLMQDFYRQAAMMYNDREGRKRLRESFERLRIFIAYNNLTSILKSTERDVLREGLKELRLVIDAEFDVNNINEGLNKM